ncbi:hypothetical protein BS50DRAFT_232553 [Corynespora cassiicola Philippines]|uniref:Uncharacterized protein n=1 Tax=Corynespora cassiicola Philippines TaxID=1448308 RepID=A0A2T2P1S8_CORCC|nr:hypothetical protein BS50DRAFT_232553 [Corynespora cassiicola Philippines]
MASSDQHASGHPVVHAPAPWTTKSETYWLFLTLKSLPKGIYDALELDLEKGGDFKGGLGIIIIVRYSDTPVGTYDELMLIPGNFSVPKPQDGPPKIPKKALRICRIYVSQRTTVYNGRINWNIPKHLARFSFSAPPTSAGTSPPKTLDVKVFAPGSQDGDGTSPFFSCTLQPFRWLPSFPFSSRYMPLSTVLVQPPLPAAKGFDSEDSEDPEPEKVDPYDLNPRLEGQVLAGTNRWCTFPINAYSPRLRGCWVTVHAPSKDGEQGAETVEQANKYWAPDAKPWAIGTWMEDAEMTIPAPSLEWKL